MATTTFIPILQMMELRPREIHDLPRVTQLQRTRILVHVTLDLSSGGRGAGGSGQRVEWRLQTQTLRNHSAGGWRSLSCLSY